MNVNDFMAKHGITDADLDRMAAPYEDGSFEPEPDGKVFSGSHLDAVGTRRVTVVYDAKDTQRVAMIARSKGVKPSSVYRDALDYYLAAQADGIQNPRLKESAKRVALTVSEKTRDETITKASAAASYPDVERRRETKGRQGRSPRSNH
jgi:hypothetical protein